MIITAGLAPDLDWIFYWAGPRSFLLGHRTFLHSIAGAAIIAAVVAGIFWLIDRKYVGARISLFRALLVCSIGAAAHLLLDLHNPWGLKLLWPFGQKVMAWDLLDEVDPWALVILLGGILLPALFRLVSEEIGSRRKSGEALGAMIALVLLAGYVAGRAALHNSALTILGSRIYHGATPRSVAAFPYPGSPITWMGVVETERALYVMDVSALDATRFDPDQSNPLYKPEPSAALESARGSRLAEVFLQFARFPRAIVEPSETGYRVRFNDLRFSRAHSSRMNPSVVIDLDRNARIIHEELMF
jgi:inner membrane protein